jgi:hypothetical protein
MPPITGNMGGGMWAQAEPVIESAAPGGGSPRCCTVGVTKHSPSSIGVRRGD